MSGHRAFSSGAFVMSVMLLSMLSPADAFSNLDVPHPEFGFEPGVIWLAVPKTSAQMTLAAMHLSIGEPVIGTKPGRFNVDLQKQGNFFRGSVPYDWKTGDVIYYWVYVIVDGLGYQRLNQQHVITERSAPRKDSPSRKGGNNRPSGPFEVPTPTFHLTPYVITVTVPALPDVSLVAIHFSLNEPVPGVNAGKYNEDLINAGDQFVAMINVPEWKEGDVIHYWVYAIHNGLGRHKLNQQYIIPHSNGSLPSPAQPSVLPHVFLHPTLSPYLPSKCGNRSTFDLLEALGGATRVFGGTPATQGEYPWQAQIMKSVGLQYEHLCGGIVISERHVLTAAHCLTDVTFRRLQVVVGQHDRRTTDDPEQQTFGVQAVLRHSRYSQDQLIGFAHDIAVILVRPIDGKGITFGDYIEPLCLPTGEEELTEHTDCRVSGWGRQDEGREFPGVLHGGAVPYVTTEYCSSEEVWGRLYNSDTHLCAGYTAGGHDTVDACEGDSGGPLACKDKEGRWKATGIVSWGSPECRALPVYVGVYTRVSSYIDWIVRTMNYLCEDTVPCP